MPGKEEEAGELIWSYIEEIREERDPAAAQSVARVPVGLAECAALVPVTDAILETLDEDTGETGGRTEPPAALVAAIRMSQDKATRAPRRMQRMFRPRWWTVACGLTAIVALTVLVTRLTPRTPDAVVILRVQSMIRDHEDLVNSPARVTVKGDDPARVAAALSVQIGYAVTPVDLRLAGASLLGGRRCMLDGQVIAFFLYRARSVPLSVYELRASRCRLPGMAQRVVAGRRYLSGTDGKYNVLAWRSDNHLYVMVSRLDTGRLVGMAQHLSGGTAGGGAEETL